MHGQRTASAIVAGIGMYATFQPWISAPVIGIFYGSSMWEGWVCFGLFAVCLLSTVVGDRAEPLDLSEKLVLLVFGGGTAALSGWRLWDFRQSAEVLKTSEFEVDFFKFVGPGLYMAAIASATLVILFFAFFAGRTLRDAPTPAWMEK
jgi:hypothetical protein